MCMLPGLFEPQPLRNSKNRIIPWDWPAHLAVDREYAAGNVVKVLKFKPELFPYVQACLEIIDQYSEEAKLYPQGRKDGDEASDDSSEEGSEVPPSPYMARQQKFLRKLWRKNNPELAADVVVHKNV